MSVPLIVVGAGGFGRETIDVIEAINAAGDVPEFDVLGVVDDSPASENLARLAARGIAYLGSVNEGLARARHAQYVIGIGGCEIRRQIDETLSVNGHLAAPPLRHPSATFGAQVEIGDGSVICAGVRVTNNIRIGRHVHLNLNVTIGHDTFIGDYVSVNPLVAISGDCHVADGVMFGTGSVILQRLNVGSGATVGAGACVVHDVDAAATVKGVPAR